jgi:hypothetical protein
LAVRLTIHTRRPRTKAYDEFGIASIREQQRIVVQPVSTGAPCRGKKHGAIGVWVPYDS